MYMTQCADLRHHSEILEDIRDTTIITHHVTPKLVRYDQRELLDRGVFRGKPDRFRGRPPPGNLPPPPMNLEDSNRVPLKGEWWRSRSIGS